jgi:hypothetical protein
LVLQRRPLVIAIYDSKWFMRVLDIVKRRGIIFHHYYTPTDVPLWKCSLHGYRGS